MIPSSDPKENAIARLVIASAKRQGVIEVFEKLEGKMPWLRDRIRRAVATRNQEQAEAVSVHVDQYQFVSDAITAELDAADAELAAANAEFKALCGPDGVMDYPTGGK